ncbi:DUF3375 domain-containing protein [uncultured Corynebacterium sp.]|uniref:DUF3375 domain-containing protein n=1 Tax=uncultured Corynebacterium sp. TaxID=159447 RepID=UPI0025E0395E|nr:DUF3375 domain-containing protein [uncultured Corynebacterium sp.]
MTNPRAEAAYRHASAAFRNPTLDLLHGRYAPFVIATLSLVFTAERPTVTVADAHVEVGDIAEALRASGEAHLPVGTGREICRYWVRVGWLVPHIDDSSGTGTEVYRLSAQAVSALEIAGRAGGRVRVSRSRMRTLLDSIDQLVVDSETDPAARRATLLAERDALDARIARLDAGEVDPVDDDQLLEEAENVLHLSRELPADFVRVAESINDMQRDVVADLRRDVRPAGEVLREYLHRGQHVMDATPEGRAFAGALDLIGQPEHIDRLTDQLQSLLAQPFARHLPVSQQHDLLAVAHRVEQGVAEVLTAQRRASHVITAQVRTHDPVRDREVDDLLRTVMSGLQAWIPQSSRGDRVDPVRSLPATKAGALRRTLNDLRPAATPEPLHASPDAPEFDGTEGRDWGGPRYGDLENYIATRASREDTDFDLAEAFTHLAASTRRPVDLLGLLEIAHRNGMVESGGVATVEARRPDGTVRRFAFGDVTASTTASTTATTRQENTDD